MRSADLRLAPPNSGFRLGQLALRAPPSNTVQFRLNATRRLSQRHVPIDIVPFEKAVDAYSRVAARRIRVAQVLACVLLAARRSMGTIILGWGQFFEGSIRL